MNKVLNKVLLVNGSPHKNGNTAAALRILERELQGFGKDVIWFQLDGKPVRGCLGCNRCSSSHRCAFQDDQANELIEKMLDADAIVIGTPVYFAGPNGALCALLDRAFYAASNYGQLFANKKAAAIATCWRAGATPSLDRINKYFSFSQMNIVTSDYWNGFLGSRDGFGTGALVTLAKNLSQAMDRG